MKQSVWDAMPKYHRRVAYKQMFISHNLEAEKSRVMGPAGSVSASHWQTSSHCNLTWLKGQASSLGHWSYSWGSHPHDLTASPKLQRLVLSPLWVRISICEFCRDMNIQSINGWLVRIWLKISWNYFMGKELYSRWTMITIITVNKHGSLLWGNVF